VHSCRCVLHVTALLTLNTTRLSAKIQLYLTSNPISFYPPLPSLNCYVVSSLLFGTGGGSALDLGKAVAALMTNTGDVFDYLEIIGKGMPIERQPMPHIAVPTTSGTGSECTKNAVLKSLSHGRKASMRHDTMLPTIAIIDPCLSVSCPQQVRHPYPSPSQPSSIFTLILLIACSEKTAGQKYLPP
jgi:hypothetical protein